MGPWGIVLMQLCICLLLVRSLILLNAKRWKEKTKKTMIVLGSGGHTAEMFQFLKTLTDVERKKITPRVYVMATTDEDSKKKVLLFEDDVNDFSIHLIPRSREVGQSYISSIFTTLRSIFYSFVVVWRFTPGVVLANGPGTCLPICFAAFCLKVLGKLPVCSIFLSESYACVTKPSLTTRLLYPFVDVLFVQWSPLLKKYKKAIYSGRMPLDSKMGQKDVIKKNENEKKSYVFVTVGTTQFNELIKAIDTPKFCDLLKSMGYSGLQVQFGSGNNVYVPQHLVDCETPNFEIKLFSKLPTIIPEITGSSLVIGHAGVGTIFESLALQKKVVVIPNEKLMNNHQLEIANELGSRGYIQISTCNGLLDDLKDFNLDEIPVFPTSETNTWKTTFFFVCGLIKDSGKVTKVAGLRRK
jgi:beta-1,4-N-acetylglucosaminyltransferase